MDKQISGKGPAAAGKLKKYSVWMDNERVSAVEVDGVRYANAELIPDAGDRERMEQLLWGLVEVDTTQAAGPSGGFPKIVLPLFIAVAAISLLVAVFSGVNTARSLAKEQRAAGFVVDLVTHEGSDGTPFSYPLVEFSLPDGSRVTTEISEGSYPPSYQVGQPVTVMYDAEQPSKARLRSLASGIAQWTLAIISGALGVAFVAASVFTRWILKPAPEISP